MTERPLILIADDDAATRALHEAVLRREGFDAIQAANGREALQHLADHPVAVVLLDVHMPVMDGLQTLHEIRASTQFRTLPVILVTGSGGENERVKGLEGGANDYLAKPVLIKELVARVRAQVRGNRVWTGELERGRESRRRLAEALEGLSTDVPLLVLSSNLVERLPSALDLDGVAILHFGQDAVRGIASSGVLRRRFPVSRALSARAGRALASRAAAGPWLEAGSAPSGRRSKAVDVAFVPFRLGATPEPLGALVFALEPGTTRPLSHRLPDLIDATSFIVAVLRPAVEQADTADAASSRIRQIIAGLEFSIHLQPIVHLETGKTVAVEALTRFADGAPPASRFAEAGTLGLGATLQRAAVAAAIEASESLPLEVALSLNLSAAVIEHEPTLSAQFAATRRSIIVELTEHERIDDYDAVRTALAALGPNVKLAIDDAGSGFASLRHIFALQPAYVKLDIEWVHGIDRDPVRRALVSGLVYFASETGCELIAEGIETEEELAAIRELGVQLGQGFLLGRPEPAKDLEPARERGPAPSD